MCSCLDTSDRLDICNFADGAIIVDTGKGKGNFSYSMRCSETIWKVRSTSSVIFISKPCRTKMVVSDHHQHTVEYPPVTAIYGMYCSFVRLWIGLTQYS